MDEDSNSENNSELKIITSIKANDSLSSMCLLKDGRIASGGEKAIQIYNKESHLSDITIKDDNKGFSICGLRNGNLVSCHKDIRIYEISGNDYKHIHTLEGHSARVNKVIELEDGRLCSFSKDKTIKIWDNNNNYQCIKTFKEQTYEIETIFEMNNYIISVDSESAVIWNKSTYNFVREIEDINCWYINGISKLEENSVIIGGNKILFILDISTFESDEILVEDLGYIFSICVLNKDKVLLGGSTRELICFDILNEQIIFSLDLDDVAICIIKSEENNKIFLSTHKYINIYE